MRLAPGHLLELDVLTPPAVVEQRIRYELTPEAVLAWASEALTAAEANQLGAALGRLAGEKATNASRLPV